MGLRFSPSRGAASLVLNSMVRGPAGPTGPQGPVYVPRVRTVTAAGDVNMDSSYDYVIVKKTIGAATIANLPAAVNMAGYALTIKDGKGDASSNNITITPNGVETIDGSTSPCVISSDYGFYKLLPVTGGWLTVY